MSEQRDEFAHLPLPERVAKRAEKIAEIAAGIVDEQQLRERPGDQPLPEPNGRPSVQSLVRADLDAREQVGISRYGTPLQPFNGRDAVRDLYEELLDGACYARQLMEERSSGALVPALPEWERDLIVGEAMAEFVLSWHPTDGSDPVEIPLGEPWVLPGTDVAVGEFRLSTREVPEGEVSGG